MSQLPENIQARRAIEDQAVALGVERRNIDDQQIGNTRAIIDLIPSATEAGVSLEDLASMVQVTRQTLYRWQETARRLRTEDEEA
jgi:transcriptional regulator GlxA family with amidase domain